MTLKPLKEKLSKLKTIYKKKHAVVSELQDEVFILKNTIDYIEGFAKLKPQILYNYGRDKKYIYGQRSEEHTLNSSHVVISYAVFCLKKKTSKLRNFIVLTSI
mgnify:CR=1 FL=1